MNTTVKKCRAIPKALLVGVLGVVSALPSSAATSGSPKPVYVETVIPGKPFLQVVKIVTGEVINSVTTGPGVGVLGISSITITNTSTFVSDVYISTQPLVTGSSCATGVASTYGSQVILLSVPGNATLHIPYPTPLVIIAPSTSLTCIGVGGIARNRSGDLYISINGILN